MTCVCLASTFLWAPSCARASVGDVFGLGSRAASLAGAVTAVARGLEATYYNPARLGGEARFAAGFIAGTSLLDAAGERRSIEQPYGILFGGSAPLPLGSFLKDRIHVGLGLFLLPGTIVREIGRAPSDPHFPLFDNRSQRVVVLPALSIKLHPRLSIGFGANVLAALGGRVSVREGPLRTLDATVDEDLLTVFSFNFGISAKLTRFLTVALTVRDEFSVPFFTDAQTSVAGTSLALNLKGKTLFEPATVALGVAARLAPPLLVSADLQFKRWSRYTGSFVAVDGTLPIPVGNVTDVPIDAPVPQVRFRDIISLRFGAEGSIPFSAAWRLLLRGGYAYEPSPLVSQPVETRLFDGDKHLFAFGAGIEWVGRFRIDIHLNWQAVLSSQLTRDATVLEGGGSVLSAGLVGSYFFQ